MKRHNVEIQKNSVRSWKPTRAFLHNDVESQNRVIKHQTQYKAKELPDFIATMQTMIINQKQEIERAVVGVGEYQVVDESFVK